MNRRVALFGGSFDPPHVGHQMAWLYVLATLEVDAVLITPCYQHAFDKVLSHFEDRLEMTRLAAEVLPRVEVSAIEGEIGGPSRTLVTVREMRLRNPDWKMSVVIGSDLENEITSWFGYEELRGIVDFVVVGRKGCGGAANDRKLEIEIPNVSSTEVRERIRQGKSIEALVPIRVREYIVRKQLYLHTLT